MSPEQVEFLKTLVPAPSHFQGTGCLPLSPDPRDFPVSLLPRVAAILPRVPVSASLLDNMTGSPYDQDGTGACVAASTCGLSSLDTQATKHDWEVFHWLGLYHEAGGTGSNGVDTRLVLDICRNQGTPLAAGGREKVIASYAFVTQQPGTFREEIKACISAGYPVTVALLLPTDFGWKSGQPNAAVTTGYHQVCGLGYDQDYVVFLNSWGSGWPGAGSPKPGVGSIRWDYLEAAGMQHNYCYAYTTTSQALPNPNPTPTPIPTPTPTPTPITGAAVTGRASGHEVVNLVRGQAYQLGGGVTTVTFSSITLDDTPIPDPMPDPNPQPDPVPVPGGISVLLTAKPSAFRNSLSVVVYTADQSGGSLPASVNGTVTGPNGMVTLAGQTTHGTAGPAIWTVLRPAPWGTPCTVTVQAYGNGLSGTASKSG